MTETSPVSFQTTVDDPVEKRLETVGRIQPHTEAKVVDPDTRAILPVNTPGELVVRGYLTMKAYWDEPQKTREVKDDEGWVSTGDLAVFDERGYCSITGRIKDMVIRGGQNLFPKEIEGERPSFCLSSVSQSCSLSFVLCSSCLLTRSCWAKKACRTPTGSVACAFDLGCSKSNRVGGSGSSSRHCSAS